MMTFVRKKLSVGAVIFDLDGTLIDSIHIYFMMVEKVLERLNLPHVSRDRIIAAAESENFSWEFILPEAVMNRKDEIIEQAWAVIKEIAPRLFEENLKLIQGADRTLQNIFSNGLKIGMVTSTQSQYLEVKMQPLKNAGVGDVFKVIITTDDVKRRKPAPDPLIACAERLKINPGHCVYVGDTATDVKAGKAAGMKTVGVLTGFDEYEILKKENPDAIIHSVFDLMEVISV